MIIYLSLPAICLCFWLAALNPAAQNSLAHDWQVEPSDLQQTCPRISVSCPADVKDDEPVTFTATVNGGIPNLVPVYDWTVSAGKIIQGQGTSSIVVARVGLVRDAFTATVSITGIDLNCPAIASCSLIIEHWDLNARKFDSYSALPKKKEFTRLDAFAVRLQNEPGAEGCLLVYGGRRGRAGEAQVAATRAKDYLVKSRGIDVRKIMTIDGGFKESLTIDLWVVPIGANPPRAEPTLHPSEVKILMARQKRSAKRN